MEGFVASNQGFHFKGFVNYFRVCDSLRSSVLDLSSFKKVVDLGFVKPQEESQVSVTHYSRLSDGFQIVVKSFYDLRGTNVYAVLIDLFLLTQLKYQCIAPLIGFVFPTTSTPLITATVYYSSGSLKDVLDNSPMWWTATMKAKTIAGIALAMKSAHDLGIVHGSLKPNNILFDEAHYVHVVDFGVSSYQGGSGQDEPYRIYEGSEEEEDGTSIDIFSFAKILFGILAHRDAVSHSILFDEEENQIMNEGQLPTIPPFLPIWVQELISNAWSENASPRYSFEEIIDRIKKNEFKFMEGVDVDEVLEFVNSIEESTFSHD
jgi:serine/threonine protein kinase